MRLLKLIFVARQDRRNENRDSCPVQSIVFTKSTSEGYEQKKLTFTHNCWKLTKQPQVDKFQEMGTLYPLPSNILSVNYKQS